MEKKHKRKNIKKFENNSFLFEFYRRGANFREICKKRIEKYEWNPPKYGVAT